MPAARRICKFKAAPSVLTKARRAKLPLSTIQSKTEQRRIRRLPLTLSCPYISTVIEPSITLSFRKYSTAASPHLFQRGNSLFHISNSSGHDSRRAYASCNVGCPCPFPCGPCGCKSGCGCLPPPCNTPPKCLQYMTGYYYYPYGTWFCGPYHVSGTCTPVGSNCPCPCPVKCCPGCVCAPPQNWNESNKNISDVNQFPVEVPCHNMPKMPQEARTGFTKMFSFNPQPAGVKKDSQMPPKPKPTTMPPVLSTMACPNPLETSTNLMDKEPSIKCSFSTPYTKPKSRSFHTRAYQMALSSPPKAPAQHYKNWKYSYYQTRRKIATPMEKNRLFCKELKNCPRGKMASLNNQTTPSQKRREPRPEVDMEIKPYDK